MYDSLGSVNIIENRLRIEAPRAGDCIFPLSYINDIFQVPSGLES